MPRGSGNRLVHEPSPYLQQHAHNPVDWYPWGEEALRRARAEDRPILLSVGYAACHWCHVMAHESFENPEIAAFMNEHFVNVKVDREERPDLDTVYQTVCQMVMGQGGWPLTVFLTPDLRPFYVGTYFPPDDRYGRPGFRRLLRVLTAAWRDRRREIEEVADEWTSALRSVERPGTASQEAPERAGTAAPEVPGLPGPPEVRRDPDDWRVLLDGVTRRLVDDFDRVHGGFAGAPKFPNTEALRFLMAQGGEGRDLAIFALRQMARGGIHDQIGGGFHRYSVDAAWQVPHFEKMLYDNALLPPAYLDALVLTGDAGFARTARDTLDYLLRAMRAPEGGFFASQDADSPPVDGAAKEEGAFYLWTPEEVRAALAGPRDSRPSDAELALAHFGVTPEGNFEGGRTVLHVAETAAGLARRFGLSEDEVRDRLAAVRLRLFEVREERPRPDRDEKVLAGWNGLALSAFARGAQVLEDGRYRQAAEACADFLLTRMKDADGNLLRRYRDGRAGIAACLEDYAYVCAGLVDVYETTFESRWLEEAVRLARRMIALFWDDAAGAFYLAPAGQGDLVQRPRAAGDSGLPSPQSVAVRTLLRLLPFTGEDGWREIAAGVFRSHRELMRRHPWGMASLADALRLYVEGPVEVTLVGDAAEWARRLRRLYIPDLVVSMVEPEAARRVAPRLAGDGRLPPVWSGRLGDGAAGGPVAYVCRDFTCSLPLPSWTQIESALGTPGTPAR